MNEYVGRALIFIHRSLRFSTLYGPGYLPASLIAPSHFSVPGFPQLSGLLNLRICQSLTLFSLCAQFHDFKHQVYTDNSYLHLYICVCACACMCVCTCLCVRVLSPPVWWIQIPMSTCPLSLHWNSNEAYGKPNSWFSTTTAAHFPSFLLLPSTGTPFHLPGQASWSDLCSLSHIPCKSGRLSGWQSFKCLPAWSLSSTQWPERTFCKSEHVTPLLTFLWWLLISPGLQSQSSYLPAKPWTVRPPTTSLMSPPAALTALALYGPFWTLVHILGMAFPRTFPPLASPSPGALSSLRGPPGSLPRLLWILPWGHLSEAFADHWVYWTPLPYSQGTTRPPSLLWFSPLSRTLHVTCLSIWSCLFVQADHISKI